jgi:energy-coupling factor transport system permease protein
VRLAPPLRPARSAPLARANPAAKLGAAGLVMLTLLVTLDPVTPAMLLAALATAVVASGLPLATLVGRLLPLAAAAIVLGAVNAALVTSGGSPVLSVGPLRLSGEALAAGGAVTLRLLGIGLAGVLFVATTDPTDLADSLVQQLRLPWRFAYGTLAAFRLLPIFGREWELLGLARRARGVEARGSPLAAARLFAGRSFSLLVGAIRRGTELAVAMDARGFGASSCRTAARRQRVRAGDLALMALALVACLAATGISMALGTWRFLLG